MSVTESSTAHPDSRALVVDDDRNFATGLAELIRREGFEVSLASSLAEARETIQRTSPDVVLLDLKLPDGNGLALMEELAGEAPPEIVLITGHASVETAVDALRRGASDYLTKPVDFARLKVVLAGLRRTRELKHAVGSLRGELRRLGRFGPLVGAGPAMQRVFDLISRAAPSQATVLIQGETGTGKELVARAIHDMSRRSKEAFLPINCGAVSPTLIESELFGHERGSFTGADRAHKGFFERANRGTLFLDEITEMPEALQVKLLRVLETGEIIRIGGDAPVRSDVRVIAATNRKVEEAVAEGKLRSDLLYRVNVFPIPIPPLRERREDVEALALHFLDLLNQGDGTSKRFAPGTLEMLGHYNWPGNVRELKNLIQRAFLMARTDVIGPDWIPVGPHESVPSSAGDLTFRIGSSIDEIEKHFILSTLQSYNGDKKRAAETLKISLKTLYNRLNEYKAG